MRLVAAAVAAVALLGAGEPNVAISIPSVDVGDAPYFVAQQKGYFAAEGLHVEFTYAGGGVATPALIAGSLQGSASGSAALSAIVRGADLRIVMVFDDSPSYQLWAHDDVRTLDDLKGRTIGIATRGDTFELSTRLMLQQAGFPADAVSYTPRGNGAGAGAVFANGGLPAVVLSRSEARELQEQGQLKNAHLLLDYNGKLKMPLNAFAVPEKLLSENPDTVRRLVRAIAKGVRYERANKDQTVAVVASFQKSPAPARIAFDYDQAVRSLVPSLTIPMDLAAKDLAVRAAMANVPAASVPPVGKAYDFGLVRAVNAELDATHWKPSP